MAENKMEKIAALFGKRLNQDFKIKCLKLWFRFTNNGLMIFEKDAGCYLPAPNDVFMELIQGKREVEK
jgi:hypothetical protein